MNATADSRDYEAVMAQLNQMEILDESFDFNQRDENGCTPLMLLCQRTQMYDLYRYVETLLSRGNIEVNAKDNSGNNALILLCEHCSNDNLIDIIRLLLEHGMYVNEKTATNGYYALILLP